MLTALLFSCSFLIFYFKIEFNNSEQSNWLPFDCLTDPSRMYCARFTVWMVHECECWRQIGSHVSVTVATACISPAPVSLRIAWMTNGPSGARLRRRSLSCWPHFTQGHRSRVIRRSRAVEFKCVLKASLGLHHVCLRFRSDRQAVGRFQRRGPEKRLHGSRWDVRSSAFRFPRPHTGSPRL